MHRPFIRGLEGFALGRSRSELHAANGSPERSSRQVPSDPWPVDRWADNAIQVSYREIDGIARAVFIEVYAGAGVHPSVHDRPVFETPAVEWLRAIEQATGIASVAYERGTLVVFHDIDIGLWRPTDDGPDGLYFKSAGFGEPGYYDFLHRTRDA